MEIPKSDIKALSAWLQECVTILKLDPYIVYIHPTEFENVGDDAFGFGHIGASIDPQPDYWNATLRLDARYQDGDPEGIRASLAHELCHLMFANSARLLMSLNENVMGIGVADWAEGEIRVHHEAEIERLTRVIAPLLPLPDFKLKGPQQ